MYWGVALMQLIATHSGLWAIDPGGLRLAWMVLTQTGYALQSFAYSKLLRMWLGYSSGVGEFVQPPLRVPKVYDRFVTLFVTVVGLNYCCQLVIAGAYYDVHKAEEEEVLEGSRTHRPEPIEPYYIAGARARGAAAPVSASGREHAGKPCLAPALCQLWAQPSPPALRPARLPQTWR